MGLVFKVTSTQIWCRLRNNLCLACQSLKLLLQMAKPKLVLQFNVENGPALDSDNTPLANNPHFGTRFENHQDSRKYLVKDLVAEQILRRKEVMRMAFLMCCNLLFHHHHLHLLGRLVLFHNFQIHRKS